MPKHFYYILSFTTIDSLGLLNRTYPSLQISLYSDYLESNECKNAGILNLVLWELESVKFALVRIVKSDYNQGIWPVLYYRLIVFFWVFL